VELGIKKAADISAAVEKVNWDGIRLP